MMLYKLQLIDHNKWESIEEKTPRTKEKVYINYSRSFQPKSSSYQTIKHKFKIK